MLLLGAAACNGDGNGATPQPTLPAAPPSASTPETTAAETAAATPTGPTTAPPASTPPFRANTLTDDGGQGSGNGLGLVAVRAARQDGFDRVTFELGGTGTPGWLVSYTATPTADGSGEPVSLKGTAFLSVVLRGVGLPDDTGVPPFGGSTTRIAATGTRQVLEIAPGSVFEGQQQAYVALSGAKRPFRVFSLTNPARVVLDVRDS